MKHIYSPRPYYQRIRTFLREYRPPKISRRMNWESLRAFLYANVRLGVFGRECFHDWSLLLWTIVRRPSHCAWRSHSPSTATTSVKPAGHPTYNAGDTAILFAMAGFFYRPLLIAILGPFSWAFL